MDPLEELEDHRKRVKKINEEEALPEVDAHGYLQGVYRGLIQPSNYRLRAAIAALPFEKPKLAVVATESVEDLTVRLEKAREATMKVVNSRPAQVLPPLPKPAELKQVTEPLVTAEDMAKPFAQLDTARFRRF